MYIPASECRGIISALSHLLVRVPDTSFVLGLLLNAPFILEGGEYRYLIKNHM